MTQTSAPKPAVAHWVPAREDSAARISDVIALAKKHRQTLGFLPDAAFQSAAEAGNLVLAHRDGALVGYALYRVTRSTIKLTHVCVDTMARGQNLGQALILHVIGAHPEAQAISARCRRDYNLNSFWEAAGLTPSSEIAGRNAKGLPLTLWRRDLGEPDLLSAGVLESDLPLAVLDSNVVIDLNASAEIERPFRLESQALMADWLADEVTFAVSKQLDHELNENNNDGERVRQVAGSQDLVRLPTTRPYDTTLEDTLLADFGAAAHVRDRSLSKDVKHLADAIRAGARYFVTNDAGVIGAGSWLRERYSLTTVSPHELISDVLDESGAYQPYAAGVFESIDLHWLAAREFTGADLERAFMNFGEHEQGAAFRAQLRTALAHDAARLLVDHKGALLALVTMEPDTETLRVPMLRVAGGQYSSSIALQLARQLRIDALRGGHAAVVVTDERLPRRLLGALREDGFTRRPDGQLFSTPVDRHVSLSDGQDLSRVLDGIAATPEAISPALSRDLEWQFWPLKVWDETPCYVVPIKPNFSMSLFGYPLNLLPQRRALGLSRRHVYFRSGHNNPFRELPARVLWYASTHQDANVQEFFALSLGVGAHVLPAEEAHERFNALGVYRRKDVLAAASKDGNVTVLVMEDTEILTKPISLDEFRSRAATYGVTAEFQAPRRIPPSLFRELMHEFNASGRGR
ncbi:GNAT family N-acetyltransferase [Agromyces sp. Root81]|uniref:GNAT family N-acetyltransferase n=1 Tax=Agromyces sp. Root81 TaxID=1736601 RepID=UPI0012F72F10|nr:GNAT family N-acetyltransferase [Agromyces sp. Root81]